MSQFARIAAAILAGFIALALIVYLVFLHDQMLIGARAFVGSVVDRTLAIQTLLDDSPPADRPRIITASSGRGFAVDIVSEPPLAQPARWPHAQELAAQIRSTLSDDAGQRMRVEFLDAPRRGWTMRIVAPLLSGEFLVVDSDAAGLNTARPATWGVLMTLLVLALVLWGAKRSTRHLPRFAAAAEALGNDVNGAQLLNVTGPREVRRAAGAFNEMAQRVRRSLDERTEMLAAVSHDLRTLLTKLALRLELIDAAEDRERARDDVREMTALIDSVLTFAREDKADEPPVKLDLATLLITLTDDEHSLGRDVDYTGPDHHVIEGRSTALRRAFANLIDNAVRYGRSAAVTLTTDAGTVIEIADHGPGIPEADRERALQPFQRLEPSRNRDTGGTGLGLAIALAVVKRHGGELTLLDAPGGGLIVRVVLLKPSATLWERLQPQSAV